MGARAEALEKVKSVEPDARRGRARIEAHRSRCKFGHLAIKLPSLLSDEAWNSPVLRHRADKVLLSPVPEQVVGVHRRPPADVTYRMLLGGLRRNRDPLHAPGE